MHLCGYAEHSKAFRFYVIEPNDSVAINLIIESRDAIFDEHKFSSVPRPSQRSLKDETEDFGSLVVSKRVTEEVDLTKEFLSSKFSMKDMGEADVILGIRIKHESNSIAISQSHYIEKALNKFNYSDCTSVSTHLDTCENLMPNKGPAVSQLEYSRVIGCIMYDMTCTRPDIAFYVGKLSKYTSNPGTQHWQAIQRIASSGWPFVFAVSFQMTHLVASLTLDSARSCVMQSAFLTQRTVSSIPIVFSWGNSIIPESFWPSILLLTVIIVAVAIVVTVVLVVVDAIIGIVVVVVRVPSIIKFTFLIIGSLHRTTLYNLIH
nr:zinc finger, CCHC-type [Tanacetum cinerariifolium]